MAAARGKRSQKHHFLWVSEVALGIFGVQFWGFSVLQSHGVLLPGAAFFHGVFLKVAKIHGSSKRKKEPKASFSMGFRSHVRHFRGTILGLLRPSEPWCFAAGSCFFPWCFPIWGPDVKVAKIHGSSKRKKEPKASFSMGFRSRVRHFRGTILGLLRPSEPWCFAAGSCFFPWCFPIWGPDVKVAKIHGSSKRKKEPKASFSMGFRSRVRHFRGTILGLLRPSEPRCFAAGSCFFPWCFPIWGPDVKVAKIHGSSKRKKEPKASFSMGFRSRVRHFRGTILGLLRPSEPWCFAAGSCFFRSLTGIRSSSRRHQSCEQPQATLDNLSRQSTNVFFLGLQTLMCLSRAKTMSCARGGGHTTTEKPKAKGWMLELHGRDMN